MYCGIFNSINVYGIGEVIWYYGQYNPDHKLYMGRTIELLLDQNLLMTSKDVEENSPMLEK